MKKGFPGGPVVKNPPASVGDTEMGVQSWGWEDPLEKEKATHSRIFAWRATVPVSQRVGHD